MNNGGYDFKFKEDTLPDRLICKVCDFPSRDPYLSVCCGHTFCKQCADAAWSATSACPMCRDNKFPVVQNKQNDREIRCLPIFCINKDKGCVWQGELDDINNHLGNVCHFEEVKCSYDCGKIIQRRHLMNHIDTECPHHKVKCRYCHDIGEREFIEGQHKEECPKLPLLCPNKCEVGSVRLEDMEAHMKMCQLEILKCSNKCGKQFCQFEEVKCSYAECPHRKVKCQYCHDTGEHHFIEGQHKEECPKLPLPCPNKCEVGSIPREDVRAHKRICRLEKVKCLNKCGKQFERQYIFTHLETECSNRTVECQHCHDLGPHSQIKGPQHRKLCPKLPLPCPNKCEFVSVPREDMEAHRKECPLEMIQCEYYSVGCEVRMARKDWEKHRNEKMEVHLDLTKNDACQTKRRLNLMQDHLCLFNKGLVKSNDDFIESIIINNSTPHIPVIIRMPGFSELKKTRRVWTSPIFTADIENDSFLSGVSLMKMSLHVYSAGCNRGSGTHLSVYLYVTEGDDIFVQPPQDKFDVKLLSHTDSTEHHVKTFSSRHSTFVKRAGLVLWKIESWPACYGGTSRFLKLKFVEQNSPFLSDDSLLFQVTKHAQS